MSKESINVSKENWWEELNETLNEYTLYRDNQLIGILNIRKMIRPKDVIDIITDERKYFIPSFQRGYRWEKKQVKDLLEDIWNWSQDVSNQKFKYCLQPLVLLNSSNEKYDYEVIDGQQRLTTLFIILKAIDKAVKFTIEYQTREKSQHYMENLRINMCKLDDNIDYYHMRIAYETTIEFFNNPIYNKDTWFEKLTHSSYGAFFIEYIIDNKVDNRNAEQIFTGLNAGKISLTNSELVKALILRKKNFNVTSYNNQFLEIAQEWDRIEKRLRERNFWSWLGEEITDQPHIDALFNIVANFINIEYKFKIEPKTDSFSYLVFSTYLDQKKESILTLWNHIKHCFMTIEDWYEDVEIYNLIGFINHTESINKPMFNLYMEYTRDENFSLRDVIRKYIKDIDKKVGLRKLEYDSKEIYSFIFLFNIITSINNQVRFKFDLYQLTKYDIEHIFPISQIDNLKSYKERNEWLKSIIDSQLFSDLRIVIEDESYRLDDSDLNMDKILNTDEIFKSVYKSLVTYKLSDRDTIDYPNRLGNLCLLDAKTNRSYGNKPFPNKVKMITELDANCIENQFVLPCTKNVFLKYYSGLNINNYVWTNKDADNYENSIFTTVTKFLSIGGLKNA